MTPPDRFNSGRPEALQGQLDHPGAGRPPGVLGPLQADGSQRPFRPSPVFGRVRRTDPAARSIRATARSGPSPDRGCSSRSCWSTIPGRTGRGRRRPERHGQRARLSPHRDPGAEQQETFGHVEPQVSAHAEQADQATLEVGGQEGADRNRGGDGGDAPCGTGQCAHQREAAQRDRCRVIDPSVQPGRDRHDELRDVVRAIERISGVRDAPGSTTSAAVVRPVRYEVKRSEWPDPAAGGLLGRRQRQHASGRSTLAQPRRGPVPVAGWIRSCRCASRGSMATTSTGPRRSSHPRRQGPADSNEGERT